MRHVPDGVRGYAAEKPAIHAGRSENVSPN